MLTIFARFQYKFRKQSTSIGPGSPAYQNNPTGIRRRKRRKGHLSTSLNYSEAEGGFTKAGKFIVDKGKGISPGPAKYIIDSKEKVQNFT